MFKDAPPRINFNTSYVSVIRSYGVVNKFIILWRGNITGYWKKSKSKPTLYISRWHIPDNCDTTKWFFSIYFLYNTYFRHAIVYGKIANLVHLGWGRWGVWRPCACSWRPSSRSSSHPGMFQGQLQTHITSSKYVPSCSNNKDINQLK